MMARKDNFAYSQTNKSGAGVFTYPANAASWWLQPSVEWQGKIGKNWTTNAGLRVVQWNYLPDNKKSETNIEPLANVGYRFDNNAALTFGYSLQSQMVSPQLTTPFEVGLTTGQFIHEKITKSHNINLGYHFSGAKNLVANVDAYYQNIFDASSLTLNELEPSNYSRLSKGRNIGVEIDVQQQLIKGFYWRVNASFYDSKYQNGTTWLNTRFNGHYITNGLIGKEWTFGAAKNRFLGVNGHVLLRGGYLDVYDNKQLKDYFRTDLNVYWKRSHARYSSTVQLDIQNVTNQQNDGWNYYDVRKKAVVAKTQLGLIPNLAYKVEF